MQISDTLLCEMIRSDMQSRGVLDYHLADELAESPAEIKVGANEAVYVYYFSTRQEREFSLELLSATTKVKYTDSNTRLYQRQSPDGAVFFSHMESNFISNHWSNITINFQGDINTGFLLRIIRVTL